MKRVLVTGGAGFIASHIVDKLVSEGNEVSIIDDLSSGDKANLNAEAKFYEADISESKVKDIIKEINPEVIVHAAAQISVSDSMKDPVTDVKINITGLMNILSSLDVENLPYFTFISTGGALYGEQDVFPAPEDHKIAPTSVYGLSKYSSEQYLDLWKRVYGLKYGVARFANVYGPRQNPHGEAGVVAIFSKLLLGGKTPTINGTGEFTRDYVYVADVVEAVYALVSKEQEGTYNIGTGVETSVNDLYNKLIAGADLDVPANYGPQRAGDQMRSVIDSSKALNEIGWQAKVDMSSGLEKTYSWFKERA